MNTDIQELQAHRRFLEESEMAVRAANQEIIHQQINEISRDDFTRLAMTVAKLRADYLAAVMKMEWPAAAGFLDDLKSKREAYDETHAGFDALKRAIEKGYVKLVKQA